MAHGFILKNSLGETVLDSDADVLCEVASGTSSGDAYHASGAFVHDVTAGVGEFIAWAMPSGRWIAETTIFDNLTNWQSGGKVRNVSSAMISNARSVAYKRLKYGGDIAATGRYGLFVKKANGGGEIFHSDMTLAWVGDGRTLTLLKPSFNAVSVALSVAPAWVVASGCASGFSIFLGNPIGSENRISRQRILGAIRRSGSSLIVEGRTLTFSSGASATYTPDKNITVSAGVLRV